MHRPWSNPTAIDLDFSSVMMDGSQATAKPSPAEYNVEVTRKVVDRPTWV
jgi:fructose/tagatose bisphosphate aldolase